jgi:hypothetical protein
VVNGVYRIVLTNNGRLGVNTVSPGAINAANFSSVCLHVQGLGLGTGTYLAVSDSSNTGILLNDSSQPIAAFSDAGSPTNLLTVTRAGSIIIGSGALATTATGGFLYVPTCAGTPTGTPTAYTGRVPLVVDIASTPKRLCLFVGGSWLGTDLT